MQEPIAAPAWSRYVTRPPFRLPCGLLAERAAGDGFRRRHGELSARVHSWSGFLTYRCSATTLLVISHHQSYGRHGARHKLLAVRQHMSRVHRFGPALLVGPEWRCGETNISTHRVSAPAHDARILRIGSHVACWCIKRCRSSSVSCGRNFRMVSVCDLVLRIPENPCLLLKLSFP